MNDCLVIIPAFNEEKNITDVIGRLNSLQLPIDSIIINDGSTDSTVEKAKLVGAQVISHPTNLGYLSAIQTGFKYAQSKNYPYVIFFDGDGQHDPNSIKDMIQAIKQEEVDVVIGSRFLSTSNMEVGFSKKIAFNFFRFIIYITTKKRITDPTSGFKAYKARVYNRFTHTRNFNYDLPDSNFIIDILLQQQTILEIPVNMFDRKHGKSKIHQTGLKPLIYMAQTMFSIMKVVLQNKYRKRVINRHE